jgi:hypothetical protein
MTPELAGVGSLGPAHYRACLARLAGPFAAEPVPFRRRLFDFLQVRVFRVRNGVLVMHVGGYLARVVASATDRDRSLKRPAERMKEAHRGVSMREQEFSPDG